MEKYYIVPEGTKLYEDFRAYELSEQQVNDCYKKWADQLGIEATSFVPRENSIGIVPTDADLNKFGDQLKKSGNKVRTFKKASEANKLWLKMVKESGLAIKSKPFLPGYFNYQFGKSWSNIFRVNDEAGTVYCHYETEYEGTTLKPYDELLEIKGSEYHRAIEEHNERCRSKQEVK